MRPGLVNFFSVDTICYFNVVSTGQFFQPVGESFLNFELIYTDA